MDNRRQVLAYVRQLDALADKVERTYRDMGLTQKQASAFVYQVDSLSDHIMEANGMDPQALANEDVVDSMVIQRDEDEPYLDTFGQPAVHMRDEDEPYVDHMNDMTGDEFHNPLVDGLDGVIHASGEDYWSDDREAGDYWNDEPKNSRTASVDYWNDDYWV